MANAESVQVPLSIQAVYLRSSSARFADNFDPIVPDQKISGLFKTGQIKIDCKLANLADGSQLKICEFRAQFEFAYTNGEVNQQELTDEEIEKLIAAKIAADFTARYAVNTADFPDMEFLKKWAQGNVILHLWPYWREFCQSQLLRMLLPSVTIPLIQINPPIPAEADKK